MSPATTLVEYEFSAAKSGIDAKRRTSRNVGRMAYEKRHFALFKLLVLARDLPRKTKTAIAKQPHANKKIQRFPPLSEYKMLLT